MKKNNNIRIDFQGINFGRDENSIQEGLERPTNTPLNISSIGDFKSPENLELEKEISIQITLQNPEMRGILNIFADSEIRSKKQALERSSKNSLYRVLESPKPML